MCVCKRENVQGDAVGPLGTRMVIGFKNYGSSDLFNDTSLGSKMRAASLGRTEQLLKEILGGEAIGWSSVGSLVPDGDARVVRLGFRMSGILGICRITCRHMSYPCCCCSAHSHAIYLCFPFAESRVSCNL